MFYEATQLSQHEKKLTRKIGSKNSSECLSFKLGHKIFIYFIFVLFLCVTHDNAEAINYHLCHA